MGFRFITKFGTKGLVNIGKMIPCVGAVIGGGLDLAETKVISNRAYKWFIEENFETNIEEEMIEIDESDFKDVGAEYE